MSRLTCSFGTIDLNGTQQTINVNSKSLMITNRADTSPVTDNVEGTGLSSWEFANGLNP